ncbi:MAG: hypothetical protein AAGG75_02830 [Bacteroidota bacterium]
MSNIENELNKRFKHQQLSDDNFDGEGLWEAIAEDLDQGQPAPSFHRGWIGVLILLIVLGGGLALVYWSSEDTDVSQAHSPQATDDRTEVKAKEEVAFSLGGETSDSPISLNSNSKTVNTATINDTTAKTVKTLPLSAKKLRKKNLKKSIQAPRAELSNISAKQATTNRTTLMTDAAKTIKSSTTNTSNHKDNNTLIAKDITTGTLTIPQTPIFTKLLPRFTFLEAQLPTLGPLALVESKRSYASKRPSIRWSVGVSGGVNTLHFNYQSDDFSDVANLKKDAENKFLGISYGIHAGLLLNNRWSLHSGVERHQLWSKFEYEQQKDIQVEKKEHLLKVWVDATSGDTLNRLYGDTSASALATRNVIHYNEYQRLSLPLEVGLQHQAGKFGYGIRAGLVLNLTTQQSGRTLDPMGEIISFEDNSSISTFQSFDIGLRLSPLLAYQLTEQWTLHLQPQWMWQRRTKFADTDMKIGIHQLNLNLGFSHFFN